MAKEELLEFDGTVTEVLPDGNFRVKLDNEHEVLAYTAGKMRKFRIRTGVGDRVIVEMSPYDLQRGRILLNGRDITGLAPHYIATLGVARTFQNLALFNGMSVLDNISVGRHHLMKAGFARGMIYWVGGARRGARDPLSSARRGGVRPCVRFPGEAGRFLTGSRRPARPAPGRAAGPLRRRG